jgi:hypothetical protein
MLHLQDDMSRFAATRRSRTKSFVVIAVADAAGRIRAAQPRCYGTVDERSHDETRLFP